MNKISIKPGIFFKEAVMYLFSVAIGIVVAYRIGNGVSSAPVQKLDFGWSDFIIFGLAFAIMTTVLTKFKFFASGIFRVFLVLVVLGGAQATMGVFARPSVSLAVAIAFCAVVFLLRNVLFHNLAMIVAIAGVSAVFGSGISPTVASVILAVMAVYDIIAVYRTRHMVQMARTMVQSGAIFGFIVPVHWTGFFMSRDKVQPGEQFLILGSGDIGLPIILISSLATLSLPSSILTALFSLIGLFVTHLVFINQKNRAAMAALPPIATFSILGYLVSLIIF